MSVFQVDVLMLVGNQNCINTWHYDFPDTAYTNGNAVRDAISGTYTDHIRGILSTNFQFLGIRMRNIEVADFPSVPFMLTTPWAGLGNTEMLPPHDAGIVGFRSILQRPNRARKYIPGLGEDMQSQGVLTTSAINALGSFAGDMRVLTVAGLGEFTLLAVRKSPVTGLAVEWNELNESYVPLGVATQRRRKRGIGI